MKKRIIFLTVWIIISATLWYANFIYPNTYLQKGFQTFLALAIIYFVFKLVFEETISKRIKELKSKYAFRKTVSILYIAILVINIIGIWAGDVQTLYVAYGLAAAGIAIALQDLFKNFVGGIMIFITGNYHVGDRIEVNSRYGDVIDIGILYTTLMEIKEWVAGEQATGRLTIIPNGYVLSSAINNYTKDYDFIWDEINIPVTYDSDWKEAYTKILTIVKKETENVTYQAGKEISKLGDKYYLHKRDVEPAIFLTLTDNWITFNIRYITEARERRSLQNKLSQIILDEIQKSKEIKIASTTLDIIGFPEERLKQDN
ncbi:MAG: mechanosensitive ion channel family protein [Candidatus Methylarchaceae archaeon HK01M]|nr:mechanosensitive ion channel family protein [Candidatus Methylarchaceae archaeon HK01M]